MIQTTSTLMDTLRTYSDPAGKIMRMLSSGELFLLTRGIYETDASVPGYCLASAIYGPSYLSFDYALSRHGLIPESVYVFTSATFEKKKKKTYQNIFGNYTYRDVPSEAYPFGIEILEENGYLYSLASPEKALCDKLYSVRPVGGIAELESLLFDDLRIDESGFGRLNKTDLSELCDKYHCNNLKYLKKMIGRKCE